MVCIPPNLALSLMVTVTQSEHPNRDVGTDRALNRFIRAASATLDVIGRPSPADSRPARMFVVVVGIVTSEFLLTQKVDHKVKLPRWFHGDDSADTSTVLLVRPSSSRTLSHVTVRATVIRLLS